MPEETNEEFDSESSQSSDDESFGYGAEQDCNYTPESGQSGHIPDNRTYLPTPGPDDLPKEGNPIVFMDIDLEGDRLGRKYSCTFIYIASALLVHIIQLPNYM